MNIVNHRQFARLGGTAAFAVLATALAWSGAALAQGEVFIDIDAKPIAPQAAPAATGDAVAISPISDATGMFPVPADRELLDSALRAGISEHPDAHFAVVALPAAQQPCDRACDASRARMSRARYLVSGEIRVFAGAYLATIEITDAADGRTVRTLQTDAVATPAALLGALKATAGEVGAALVSLLQPPPAVRGATAAASPVSAAVTRPPQAFAAAPVRDDEAYAQHHSRRNAGIGVFVVGIILSIPAGVFIGLASGGLDEMYYAVGIPLGVIADAMFFTGIGVWVSNQVKMNKAEKGIPVGRSLRLEGLSPVVASERAVAPGLGARFSF
jgi:hypothetical protein